MKIEKILLGPNNRKIYVYRKLRWGHHARSEKWGVRKTRKKPQKRELLVLGTGRTGSKFISHVFKKWKLDLAHEKTGRFGSSTHFYHTDHHWYPMFPWMNDCAHVGERLSDFDFKHRLHVIRNPLTCIPSIEHIFGTIDWEFAEETGLIEKDDDLTKRQRIMRYWLNLNTRLAMQCDTTIKLENIQSELLNYARELMGDSGLKWPNVTPKNKGTGYRRSQPITTHELMTADEEIGERIIKVAKGYGYEV